MKQIKAANANELFVKISREMLTNGKESSPRGLKTIELRDVWLTLTNPMRSIVSLPSRNTSLDYIDAEMAWYLHGDYKVHEISKGSKFWLKLANNDMTVNSNYGQIAMRDIVPELGKTQWQWCIDRFAEDHDTRQAIINYNQTKHKYEGNKDFVCTIAQLFRSNDNKLDSTVMIRSNDFIYGLTYDLPWFTHVLNQMAHDTDLKVGKYNHFAASLHVYEKHFGMLENMANEKLTGEL